MAAKTSWSRYGTKLRHGHPMYYYVCHSDEGCRSFVQVIRCTKYIDCVSSFSSVGSQPTWRCRVCCWAPAPAARRPQQVRCAAIDLSLYLPQKEAQQTRRTPLLLSIDWTDRRTDRRTLDRLSQHTMRARSTVNCRLRHSKTARL